MPTTALLRIAPLFFVLIWSTSWLVVKYVSPFADPLTFLTLRFEFAALFAVLIAYAASAPQPKSLGELGHMLLSGVLMYALYKGGGWWAIAHGMPISVSVVIAALQPLLSAALEEPLLGEKTQPRQWIGVILGFVGVLIVVSPGLTELQGGVMHLDTLPLLLTFLAVLSVTLGCFHQKRFIRDANLCTLSAYQHIGAFIVTFAAAWIMEPMYFELQLETTLGLAWSVLVLSILGMGLFFFMIRHNSVTRVTSLIYLMTPIVALQGYLLFDERLSPLQITGMVLTTLGVYLATRSEQVQMAAREGG